MSKEIRLKDFSLKGLPEGVVLPSPDLRIDKCFDEDNEPTTRRKFFKLLSQGYTLFKFGEPMGSALSSKEVITRVMESDTIIAARDPRFAWEFSVCNLEELKWSVTWRRSIYPDPLKTPVYFDLTEFLGEKRKKGETLEVVNQDRFFRFLNWDGWCHSLKNKNLTNTNGVAERG